MFKAVFIKDFKQTIIITIIGMIKFIFDAEWMLNEIQDDGRLRLDKFEQIIFFSIIIAAIHSISEYRKMQFIFRCPVSRIKILSAKLCAGIASIIMMSIIPVFYIGYNLIVNQHLLKPFDYNDLFRIVLLITTSILYYISVYAFVFSLRRLTKIKIAAYFSVLATFPLLLIKERHLYIFQLDAFIYFILYCIIILKKLFSDFKNFEV